MNARARITREQAPSDRRAPGKTNRGWGFKIDYARDIREDEAHIAHLTNPMCILISRELLPEAQAQYPEYTGWCVYEILVREPKTMEARAARFDLTLGCIRAWALFLDEDLVWSKLGDLQKGDYARGEALEARLGRNAFEVLSEQDRRQALAKARASLARHKRNQEKYEG
jgi:hypothetical protein